MPALFAFALASALPAAEAATPEPLWETAGFSTPESVVFDRQRGVFYVSNIGTRGEDAVPGDGFISRLAADGTLLDREWVTGLENPKGLALANGRLYAGDDDALVEIDLDAARILARHAPPDGGPARFNDTPADADGNVYAFSPRLDTVFRLHQGRLEPWLQLDVATTGRPNGLRVDGERLLLGSWQVPPDGAQPGHLSTVALADRSTGRIGSEPIGHIDGIEPDGRGGWTVTDWTRGLLLHVDAGDTTTPLLTLSKGSADHLYLADRELLVVPMFFDNVVRAWRWAPDAKAE
ncbi:hypothetical protein CSC64_03985 [Pseudoxanthomonas koreensis]|nr:hypothetical protein CSC64_03985 [Pseudoxanthomonas koreensis]